MSSLTVYPNSYDTSKSVFSGVPTNPDNAYTTYDDGNYASYYLVTGANAKTYIYYTFDLSTIPANATIKTVSCTASAFVTDGTTTRIAIKQLQLFSGNTAKGTPSDFSTASTYYELDTGTWTRQELDDLYLRVYVQRGTQRTTSSYMVRVIGADLTIEYESGGAAQTLKIKSNGSWNDVSKVYKKENGTWIEVQDISQEFDVNTNYYKEN